jgi:hypothetical protein
VEFTWKDFVLNGDKENFSNPQDKYELCQSLPKKVSVI